MHRKRWLRWGGAVLLVALVAGGAYRWLRPAPATYIRNLPAQTVSVQPSRFLVQRGAYLFHVVSGCASCHSPRQTDRFAMPIRASQVGAGGRAWGAPDVYALPVAAPNLTPTALTGWTDGQLIRAFTRGIAADDRALTVACPWPNYQHYDALDAQAVVAYIRALAPQAITSKIRRPRLKRFEGAPAVPPRRAHLGNKPLSSDTLATGRYLLAIAACSRCHGPDLGGGRAFNLPGGARIYASNLSPDSTTGIGRWNEARFLQRFRRFALPGYRIPPVHANGYNSPMPWQAYAQLTEADLRALYRYLRTLPPVSRATPPFAPTR